MPYKKPAKNDSSDSSGSDSDSDEGPEPKAAIGKVCLLL
jgi:hypothetical protein